MALTRLNASYDSDFLVPARLCGFCSVLQSDLFSKDGFHTSQGTHHSSFASLGQSAANGCSLCRILISDVSTVDSGDGSDDDIVCGCQHPNEGEYIPHIRCQTRSGSFVSMVPFNGIPYLSKEDMLGQVSHGARYHSEVGVGELRGIKGQIDSDETFDLIKKCIDFCRKHHKACQGNDGNPMPSRVLDVGSERDTAVHLCNTSDVQMGVPYVTLSHCWGTPTPEEQALATTTCENIDNRRKEIVIESLPKTFRDAIRITRKLNVKYLWIDSLCIIQDSFEDKQREILDMGNIYFGSHCTIAASTSTGMHSGCLMPRNHLDNQPLYLSWSQNGLETQRVIVFPPKPDWRGTLNNEPLNRRAWVFQERQLSPRTLHFTRHQVFWECGSSSASEIHQHSGLCLPPRKLEGQDAIDEPIKLFEGRYQTTEDNGAWRLEMYQRWRRILENYTSRNLTYRTDIMAALAGVALKFQQLIGCGHLSDTYVQGIWKRDLTQGLLWFVVRPQGLCKRDLTMKTNVHAPSWSWSSVMGRHIEYSFAFHRPRPVLTASNKLRQGKTSQEPEIRVRGDADLNSYIKAQPMMLEISAFGLEARMQNIKVDGCVCDLFAVDGDDGEKLLMKVRLGTCMCDTQADMVEDRRVWVLSMWDLGQTYSRNGVGLVIVPVNGRKVGKDGEVIKNTFERVGLADTLDLGAFDVAIKSELVLV